MMLSILVPPWRDVFYTSNTHAPIVCDMFCLINGNFTEWGVHADVYVFIAYLRWEVSFSFDVSTVAGGNRKTTVISWYFLHVLSEQNSENGRR